MGDAKNNVQFSFRIDESVQSFSVPKEAYIKNHAITQNGIAIPFIGVSAYVIDAGATAEQQQQQLEPPRILLIQRAASDSSPNLWEVPGGACDAEDPSILHSCARELWEEASLLATEIGPRVGEPNVFLTRSGKLFCKLGFLVKTAGATRASAGTETGNHQVGNWTKDEDDSGKEGGGQSHERGGQLLVRLDPKEHQNHVWASKEEVISERVGDLKLTFTSRHQKQIILQAFETWKQGPSSSS